MKFSNLLQSGFEFTQDEYELRLKYILFNCLIACNVTLVLIAGVLRFTTGDNLQGFVDFTYVTLATLIALLARRSQKIFTVLVFCIMLLSFIIVSLSYKIAVNDISGISWFLILMLVAAYLTDRKTTYILFFVALSLAIYISASMEAKTYTVTDIIHGMVPLLVTLFFVQFYEVRNTLSRERQRSLNSELKKQVQNTTATTAELSVSEDRFRNLIENLSDWVWETDKNGMYSYASPSVQQILGYEPAEIEEFSYHNFFSETALPENEKTLEQYFIKNEPFRNQVVKAKHSDGSSVRLEISGQPTLDSHGEFSGYRGVSRDISRRVKFEETQRKNQKKLDALLNATTDAVFLADPNGTLLTVNNALAERFGGKNESLIGRSIFEFTPTEALAERTVKLKKLITTKQPLHWEEEYDGRNLDNSLYPILGEDGNVAQVAVFSKDITKQKQAGEERERLLQAIDQSSETIVITDKEGTIQYVNPAFTKITGYSSAEAIGQNPRILKSKKHGAKFYKTMWATLVSGKTWYGQFINKKKDGSPYTEDVTISPVQNSSGEIINYVAVKRDISKEIRAKKQHIELEEQLRQKYKMEAIGVMAGGMAHNFNNNLAIILGNIELSKRKLRPDATSGKYLDNAKIAALRSRDLIQQIMTYSRQSPQSKAPTQLPLIIDETIQLLRSTIPTTINLHHNISPDSRNRTVHIDSSQVQECLINLCNNAMQAMDETGDLTISLETVELQQPDIPAQYESSPGIYAKISIQDTGCGIPAEDIDKIFDLFFSTKGVDEGTGIGLSTVHGIVNQHGGLIKASSALGEGTTFELYFPIVEEIGAIETKPEHEDIPKGTERILFIDDEEMLANVGKEILSGVGYKITSMTDSTAALNLFTANPEQFDLIITDQTMPNLCGTDLIRKIKEIRPELPTIICTGYSRKINADQAKQQGINAFCLKPLNLQELLQTVRQVLDEQMVPQGNR